MKNLWTDCLGQTTGCSVYFVRSLVIKLKMNLMIFLILMVKQNSQWSTQLLEASKKATCKYVAKYHEQTQ